MKQKELFDRFRTEQLGYLRDYFKERSIEGGRDVTHAVRSQDFQKASEKVGRMDFCDQLAGLLDREIERRSKENA